jgi:hypothetical protein
MKKTKIKQIPMYYRSRYDSVQRKTIWSDVLSHADYDGEIVWADGRTEDGRMIQQKPVMIDNVPWEDTLHYTDFYRGRSAAGAVFSNSKNQVFTVFMTDLDKFIPHMVKGQIEGKFIYCKRGKNYGVTLFEG